MSIITRIEDKLGALAEGPFNNKKGIEPLIIEVALKKSLESRKQDLLGKIIAPNAITIILDETTHNEYLPFLDSLRISLQDTLSGWLSEKGFELLDSLKISFVKGAADRQSIDIAASFKSPEKSGSMGAAEFAKATASMHIWQLVNLATGDVYPIYAKSVVLGRDAGCDVVVSDRSVSRRHASVVVEPEKLLLKDLGSASGTRVNHERVYKKILQDRDKISIGNTELMVRRNARNKHPKGSA